MKLIRSTKYVTIPKGVSIKIESRTVVVKGPRGSLTKDFKHLSADISLVKVSGVLKLKVEVWFGGRYELACIRTVCSHIENLITGVTKGYEYKMRFAYAHFPVNVTIVDEGRTVEVRNFLGEKIVRRVEMLDGVTVTRTEKVKDEIVLTGNSLENVSQSAASIHQCCAIKVKDIRKFLDGIYVSERNVIGEF
eukprot:TRINITY_DN1787_c0_g1_i2.p1 TRINITY_DN1787_c0_g1~~TRINITY_DN1787_c0_g1_i2.p1  ORF type:complete len:192 (-),score=26.97 TRINITY_DN1787_c0_g1_i2:188-763(-)